MKRIREAQLVEKTEWQDLLKQGWKIDEEGNKYKTEEIPDA